LPYRTSKNRPRSLALAYKAPLLLRVAAYDDAPRTFAAQRIGTFYRVLA
jgi:hypothetical protein